MILETMAPGEARCPGASTRDIVLRDRTGVPEALLTEAYEFLGDQDIPYSRYTSRDFARAEADRMWPKVWQWACREEHIAEPGTFHVYDIGDRSVLIVRTAEGQIRGYENFCLHRGTQLKPSGSSGKTNNLRCPFHGWSWSLDGRLVDVPCRWDFPHVVDEEFTLPEVRVDTWGGFVFVNFDAAGRAARRLPRRAAGALRRPGRSRTATSRCTSARCCRPTGRRRPRPSSRRTTCCGPTRRPCAPRATPTPSTTCSARTSRGCTTPRARRAPTSTTPPTEQEIVDLLLARKFPGADIPTVPDGLTARDVYASFIQRAMGERYGRDFSTLSVSETIDTIEYFVFPNGFFFPGLLISHDLPVPAQRRRPRLVDLRPAVPARQAHRWPSPPPAEPYDLGVDDSYTTVPGMDESFARIFDQDTANLGLPDQGLQGQLEAGRDAGQLPGGPRPPPPRLPRPLPHD